MSFLSLCVFAPADVRGYLPLYRDKALPFLHSFKPDLVIISAGYDTLNEDNLAQVSQSASS
jgi:acetoin utilization deacetylase AcuC-like enzyme